MFNLMAHRQIPGAAPAPAPNARQVNTWWSARQRRGALCPAHSI